VSLFNYSEVIMFISKFSVENWQGNLNKGSVQLVKNWQQIETAIHQLDGDRRTLVTLETEGETHMAIGGGKDKYLVYLTFDNEKFYQVIEPSSPDVEQSLVVGGQEGIYPAKFCVDKNTAIKAAKTFAELGVIEKSVTWERDGITELV
jgi:hypothetical protein